MKARIRSLVSTHEGLAALVVAVAVIGTVGSLVGQNCPLVPASSFGSTGQWVAGAAALALIQAMRIEQASQRREALHLAAVDAEAQVAMWSTTVGGNQQEARAAIARSVQLLALQANSGVLYSAADLVKIVRPSEKLPSGYAANPGEPLVEVVRADLVRAAQCLATGGKIPPDIESRLSVLPNQVRFYQEQCAVATDFGRRFSQAFKTHPKAPEAIQLMARLASEFGSEFPAERDDLLKAIEQLRQHHEDHGTIDHNLRFDVVEPRRTALQQAIQNRQPDSES